MPDARHGGALLYPGSAEQELSRLGGAAVRAALFGLTLMVLGLGVALGPLAPAEVLARLDGPGELLLDYRAHEVFLAIQEEDLPAVDRWLRVGIGEPRLSAQFRTNYLNRNSAITRRLLAAGADPDARNDNRRTQPTHADADPSLRNAGGQSAYDIAAAERPAGWLDDDVMARLRDF